MFYAIAHIPQPVPMIRPAPIVRLVRPAAPSSPLPALQVATGTTPAASFASRRGPVNGAVFEMPAGLPAFLRQIVTVPVTDETSEFAAIESVARQTGMPFSHKGPDYALVGTKVPFGKPVPSYEFLWYVGHSYIPGTVKFYGVTIVAVNKQVNKG